MIPRVGRKLLGNAKYPYMNMNMNMTLPNNPVCICVNRIATLEKEILEIKEQLKESNKINKEIQEAIKLLTPSQKGGMCSISGNNYEKDIYNITSKCKMNGSNIPFNTQDINSLGGSSSKNDIICNFEDTGDIGIEAKKHNTPDWMQCSIKFNGETKKWETSKGKNPDKCREIFDVLVNSLNLYGGEVPPFMLKPMTHEEWTQTKKETDKWNDVYMDIPSYVIRNLYAAKGCQYIQVSDGYGLYHLGDDICGFDVPIFEVEQQLRVRTKIHTRKNSKGFCSLSVTIACQPKDIRQLASSPYSLDDIKKLPDILIHKEDDAQNDN
jgi:hypothetical protein